MSPKFAPALAPPGLIWSLVLGLWGLILLVGTPSAHAGKCPNLVIVLDKSGSMTESPAGGTAPPGGSKWELAKAALKELLRTHDGQLPIGLALFGSDSGCGAAKLDIAPDYGTAAKIGMLIDSHVPDSSTPTSESITAIANEAVLHDASRAEYILLLTDGAPNCAAGEPDATVTAITAAHMRSPAITTFVLGFGSLPAAALAAMDRMAVAGGAPATGTPQKFYTADDLPTLKASLDKIFAVISGTGVCDDSCYTSGCPRLPDLCILGICRPNPCAGISCPLNSYCYTDGVTPGSCLPGCRAACAPGKSCRAGTCVADPCGGSCGLESCDAVSHKCVPDPLCTGVVCKGTSRCMGGSCVEDPCMFITCPLSTRCVAWNGTCEYDGGGSDMASGGSTDMPSPMDMAGGGSDMAGGGSDMAGGGSDMASGGTADMSSSDLAGWVPPDFGSIPGADLGDGQVPAPMSGCNSAPGAASMASLFAMVFMVGAFLRLQTRKRA